MRYACGNKDDTLQLKIERLSIDAKNSVPFNQQLTFFTVMKVYRDAGAAGKFSGPLIKALALIPAVGSGVIALLHVAEYWPGRAQSGAGCVMRTLLAF